MNKNIIIEIPFEPVNSVAKRVISRGSEVKLNKKLSQEIWFAPPPVHKTPDDIEDFKGKRIGKMVIIGYLGKTNFNGNKKSLSKKGAKKQKWLARCDCGEYEIRNSYTIKNTEGKDSCQKCKYLDYLKSKKRTKEDNNIFKFFGRG